MLLLVFVQAGEAKDSFHDTYIVFSFESKGHQKPSDTH